jgi:hypothetical protein
MAKKVFIAVGSALIAGAVFAFLLLRVLAFTAKPSSQLVLGIVLAAFWFIVVGLMIYTAINVTYELIILIIRYYFPPKHWKQVPPLLRGTLGDVDDTLVTSWPSPKKNHRRTTALVSKDAERRSPRLAKQKRKDTPYTYRDPSPFYVQQ